MTAGAELRLTCWILAVLAFAMGQVLLYQPAPLHFYLDRIDDSRQNWIAWGMMLHSLMLIVSLIIRCRTLRLWGLAIGAICVFALGATLLSAWVPLRIVILDLVWACSILVLLVMHVNKKPRWNL
jgi:hypothetical protein